MSEFRNTNLISTNFSEKENARLNLEMSRNLGPLILLVVIVILVACWLLWRNRENQRNAEVEPIPEDPLTKQCCADSDCPDGTICDLETRFCAYPSLCPEQCPEGPPGVDGAPGVPGQDGGVLGSASYIRTIQSPNNSVPPGTAFTVDTQVLNTMPTDVVVGAGAGGTVWTLNTVGSYTFDYEMSLGSAGSIALYTGPSAGSLAINNNTIAGSSSATTWIHGRGTVVVASTPVVVAVSSVVGTANVVVAGNAAGFYVVRVHITRVA